MLVQIEDAFRRLIAILVDRLSVLAIPALMEYQGLADFRDNQPFENAGFSSGLTRAISLIFKYRYTSEEEVTIATLMEELDSCMATMICTGFPPVLANEIVLLLVTEISAVSLNHALLRSRYVSWRRGIQVQYNVSRLEEWICRAASRIQDAMERGEFSSLATETPSSGSGSPRAIPRSSACAREMLSILEPLVQMSKLMQLAKTAPDAESIISACPSLSPAQIHRLLVSYTPDQYEDGPVSARVIGSILDLLGRNRSGAPPGESAQESITVPVVDAYSVPLHICPRGGLLDHIGEQSVDQRVLPLRVRLLSTVLRSERLFNSEPSDAAQYSP